MNLKTVLPVAFILFGTIPTVHVYAQWPSSDYQDHLPGLDSESNNRRSAGPAREPRVIKTGPLGLSDQDQIQYASFLALPNTGLIRLLPRTNPKSAFAYAGEKAKIRGDGAYFSFHYRSHEYGYGSDLELSAVQEFRGTPDNMIELPPRKYFSVGFAGADFGMLTNLGDLALTDLSIDDPRVSYLLTYETPLPESEARAECQRFSRGVTIGGQTYITRLPLQTQGTYLLRSINYDVSDRLVAFHVVREESDGSVVIAWKLLRSYPRPELVRTK